MNLWSALVPLFLLGGLISIAFVRKGTAAVGEGFSKSGTIFLGVAPQLLIGFLLAGFAALVVPQEGVARLLGERSGARGLLLASLAGMLTPGGPFTHFPLLAALRSQGAAIGPLSAYITAWSLLGLHRIVLWEGPLLGWRFVMIRAGASLLFAPAIGWIAQTFSEAVRPLVVSGAK